MEAQVIAWVAANWPSLTVSLMTSGILFAAYLKLHKFDTRLKKIERSQRRHLKVCSSNNPDRGTELFNGDEVDE